MLWAESTFFGRTVPTLLVLLAVALLLGASGSVETQVGKKVLEEIKDYAAHNSTDPDTYRYIVRKGCESYLAIQKYENKDVASAVLFRIKAAAAKNHPGDYATQYYLVKKEAQAWIDVQRFTDNKISYGGLVRNKEKVAKDHPDDYSTQIYVLRKGIKEIAPKRTKRPIPELF